MATLWCLPTAALGLAAIDTQLLIARCVIGVGDAGYTAPRNCLNAAAIPKPKRALMISVFEAVGPVGSILGVVLGGTIGARWGWRYAFGVVALPGLVFALLVFFVHDCPTVPATVRDQGEVRTMTLRETLSGLSDSRLPWLGMIGNAIQWFVASTVLNWLHSLSNRVYGLPLDQAGRRTDPAGRPVQRRIFHGGDSGSGDHSVAGCRAVGVALGFHRRHGDLQQPGRDGALGPLVIGVLSDTLGLRQALLIVSFVPLLAMAAFFLAVPIYQHALRDGAV